jgi:uncharacterized Zn-binding protein involved in type VI secretion
MSTGVFANGDEICSKTSSGKVIANFPDPCWSPPAPPAGPVVIPYPNTALASDLTEGSTSVFVKGKEIALKDQSYFSTSTGDEPATEAFQKGVATSVIKGKAYFVSWSSNVKVEGMNVCRHMDMMTQNHA